MFPALRRVHNGHPWPTSTGPAARRCRSASSTPSPTTCSTTTPTPTGCIRAARRPTRCCSDATARVRGVLQCAGAGVGQLRAEHDHHHLPPGSRPGAAVGRRATRSSSPSSITTATSIRGGTPPRTRGVTVRTVPLAADGVSLDMDAVAATLSPRTDCWPSAPRPTPSARSPMSPRQRDSPGPPALSSSSTPCTTRRTSSSTSRRSGATCWRARRTSSTGRTRASSARVPT